jgi:hypothetical protein
LWEPRFVTQAGIVCIDFSPGLSVAQRLIKPANFTSQCLTNANPYLGSPVASAGHAVGQHVTSAGRPVG